MKPIELIIIILATLGVIACFIDISHQEKLKAFYDGEGNPIPDSAVHLLVKNQFVHLSREDSVVLKKYFYLSY